MLLLNGKENQYSKKVEPNVLDLYYLARKSTF